MKVLSCAAVDHTITGAHLVAVLAGHIPQWLGSRSYGGCHTLQWAGWLAGIQGARNLHLFSACDLESLEWASICS